MGWVWGASGRSAIDLERRGLEERVGLAEARALVLDARVDLISSAFDAAGRKFAAARVIVEPLQIRARESGQGERAGRFEIALAELRDAERLSGALDASARTAAERAVQALQSLAGVK